jgi:hypothetical protein
MRQSQRFGRSRIKVGNEILEKLDSGPQNPSKQRIADLLDLLQQVERAEKLLWEDLSRRMRREGWNQSTDKFQELWKSLAERKYDALLSKINRLLQRYRSAPVLQPPFFEVDELTGLRFRWELDRGGKWTNWENAAVQLVLDLIERREFQRLRNCRNCSKWFYGQTDHQVHCSDDCRKKFATNDPKFKEKRRLYMAKRRKEEKEEAARSKSWHRVANRNTDAKQI